MKKLCLLVLFISSFNFLMAQPNRVVSAFNYLKDGRLDKALENINFALEHPKTANDVKTWLYKGNIYLAIALTDNPNYKKLAEDPLKEAYEAYQKCMELDKDYVQPTAKPMSATLGLYMVGEQYYNRGVELYNKGQYADALPNFEKTKHINSIFNVKDSLATFNAALCAMHIKDNEKAISLLRELVTMNYRNPAIYVYLTDLYLNKNDVEKASVTIKTGKNRFPGDLNILKSEINVYLKTNDFEKALNTLKTAIEKDDKNPLLYFTIGTIYDELFKNSVNDAAKREEYSAKIIENYLKAIELKPDYFDPYYNLGAFYFNEGVRIFEESEKLTDFKQMEKAKAQYEAQWIKAIPYLEKAIEINPNDLGALTALKTIYARLSKMDDLNRINEMIKKITKQ